MSQYTTGELAKACGVTVRTVQFYDQKGILIPSALTEGGRRLYSEADLKRMKIICFLRDTGLSLDTIGKLLEEEDPGSVISIFLEQQEQVLREEISERQEQMNRLELLTGLPVSILQWAAILLWIFKGIWWLFPVWAIVAIIYGVTISRYYYRSVAYICPQCHEVFKPAFKEMFWAKHTPKTRKLTCVKCGHHGYCVETWAGEAK